MIEGITEAMMEGIIEGMMERMMEGIMGGMMKEMIEVDLCMTDYVVEDTDTELTKFLAEFMAEGNAMEEGLEH